MAEDYYVLPSGIEVNNNVVVDIYLEYPNLQSFEDENGKVEESDTTTVINNYYVNQVVESNTYENGESAPVGGIALLQKVTEYPLIGPAVTALGAAIAAATEGLVNPATNALLPEAGSMYAMDAAIVELTEQGTTTFGIAGLMAVGNVFAACAAAALGGYMIGSAVYDNISQYPWFQELVALGEDWIINDDSKLAGLYRKVLGIQYGNQTYLDSRFYEAVNEYLNRIAPKVLNDYVVVDDTSYPVYVPSDASNEITFKVKSTLTNLQGSVSYDISGFFALSVLENYPGIFSTGWAGSSADSNHPTVHYFYFDKNNPNSTPNNSVSLLSSYAVSGQYQLVGPLGTGIQGYYSYTKNGKTVRYMRYFVFNSLNNSYGYGVTDYIEPEGIRMSNYAINDAFLNNVIGPALWEMAYGDIYNVEYPDGLEEAPWEAPEDPSDNAIHIVVDISTGTTIPFYPVAFPVAPYAYPYYPPGTQIITTTDNPETQILPYHIPPEVLPETNPESDPDDNPSNPAPVIIPIVLPIGGGGSSGGQSPSIPIPTVFPPWFDGASQYGGLYTVYAPTQQQLYDFGDFLWVKWTDASLPKIINNPFDGVISLHEIYATPGITGAKEITSGFLKSNVTAATVGDRYTEIDCGTVIVPENYQNYLDYSPYSKVYCFLPFIGLVQLNSDDIVGHAVNITYKVDSYSGACVAIITVAQSNGDDENYSVAMYQFEGNCAVQLPISGGSQASLTAGLWLAGSSAVGSIVNGVASMVGSHNVMNLLEGISGAISDVSATLLTRKSDVQHSGNMAGNFGAMAGKKPYLIVKFPRQVPAPNYNMDYGYPAHRRVTIGQCTGYLRVREVNIISATATDDEKAKIEQLLKEGVYFE